MKLIDLRTLPIVDIYLAVEVASSLSPLLKVALFLIYSTKTVFRKEWFRTLLLIPKHYRTTEMPPGSCSSSQHFQVVQGWSGTL